MEMKSDDNRWFWLFMIINAAMLYLYLILAGGCTSAKNTTETETVSRQIGQSSTQQAHINITRDTIHTRDSVIIRQKNDTVYYDRWHITYKAQRIADTVFVAVRDSVIRCDTVRLQQTTTVEPKRKPKGLYVWLLPALLAGWFAAKIKRHFVKS